jgi:hypothetical protein
VGYMSPPCPMMNGCRGRQGKKFHCIPTGVKYQVAADLIFRGLLEEVASYALLFALSGFRYSAVEQTLTFTPQVSQESFRCFFAAGSGWALIANL